ncbi:MAG TPA: hypothetical protein VNG71_03745 [Pyrinomonadaceae bacterium]|nr:hypothetical protein [Pyrinomonadaceae bacterium]
MSVASDFAQGVFTTFRERPQAENAGAAIVAKEVVREQTAVSYKRATPATGLDALA